MSEFFDPVNLWLDFDPALPSPDINILSEYERDGLEYREFYFTPFSAPPKNGGQGARAFGMFTRPPAPTRVFGIFARPPEVHGKEHTLIFMPGATRGRFSFRITSFTLVNRR